MLQRYERIHWFPATRMNSVPTRHSVGKNAIRHQQTPSTPRRRVAGYSIASHREALHRLLEAISALREAGYARDDVQDLVTVAFEHL